MRRVEGTFSFSPTDLVGHLACRHLTQLERALAEGRLRLQRPIDPRLEAMRQRGRLHEDAYVEGLRAAGRSIVDLRGEDDAAVTLEAMRAGHDVIVQAPLADSTFRGRADVLLRSEAGSALGGHSYEPVDTKLAVETRAGTILQLCAYASLLESLQGLLPTTLHVVTPACQERYRSADFLAYFRFVRHRLLDAVATVPAPVTYPDPVPHCDVCGFWVHCVRVRRDDDHLSLVAGIQSLHLRELQRQGISTVRELAATEGELPEPPARGSVEIYRSLGQQARLQVEARAQGVLSPPWELLPIEVGRGFARLPEPSPGDVFLDIEGDPFVPGGGLEYLFGWTWQDPGHGPRYASQWAWNSASERSALDELFQFLDRQDQLFPEFHIYSFGSYEATALKRLVGTNTAQADHLDRLLRGQKLVDLHAVVREGARIGVERYGLKELEEVTGFHRETDLREAAKARLAVEIPLELGTPDSVGRTDVEVVRAYNEDDCWSAAALRDWLEARRAELLGAGDRIDRPAAADATPSEKVTERDEAIREVAGALLAGLSDSGPRTDEEQARWVLGHMLGYFRREEKCAWWEHFRLRDLPPDRLLGEREAVSGLEFLSLIPPEGRQRLPRHRYRFPAQETAIDVGDGVCAANGDEPDGSDSFGTVVALDLDACTIEVRPTQRSVDHHPPAVFERQHVPVGELEESLLSLGRDVVARGFNRDGAFRAARDLLLRRPPRQGESAEPLREAGEDLVAATIRLCRELDGGTLPVQGPPGSGKTYVGARAIAALAGQHRVGVTAVSHKVIDNLLEEVGRAAGEQETRLELVHRDDQGSAPSVRYTNNAEAAAAVRPRTVVGATAWFWARSDLAETLDYLFVDEAGQMALAQVLAAARSTRNLVLLGDPQQLEQPRRGAHPVETDVAALVHLLGADRATLAPEQGLFLDRTWRLHPTLCAFTSESYYDDRLRPVDGLEAQELRGTGRFSGSGLFLVEVSHEGNQASSPEEAEIIAEIAEELVSGDAKWVHWPRGEQPLTPQDVLVVAPYNTQVALLRRRLRGLGVERVGTVDKFQGQEAPLVVYSCTSSSQEDAPRGMSFLYDPHRFNVATSRARCAVIVVASPRLFEPECRTPEQMRWANGLCRFRELATKVNLSSKA